jgi:excisionase family DNA binding protein
VKPTDPSPPSLLTLAEVASLLRKHVKTVEKMARKGELPGVLRVGRGVRVRAVDLDAWLAGGAPPLDQPKPPSRRRA